MAHAPTQGIATALRDAFPTYKLRRLSQHDHVI